MIQFNLLPDIKLEFIKAQRAKRGVILIASIMSGAALGLLVLLFVTVSGFNRHIDNLDSDISAQKSKLSNFEDLDKILTIQNQLNSLTGLHEDKPVVTRFYEYLPQLVPAETKDQRIFISSVKVNMQESTISFEGSANNLVVINKFVDILKFTTFKDADGNDMNAFNDVVLEFSTQEETVNYQIDLVFEPAIFDSRQDIELTVPDIISTRSETEKPNEGVFREQQEPSDEPEEEL
ncbi:MAG: hypothetical protein U5L95_05560 [Candidatus Saccharibacteria bacterium]|nr:hypothetical protein [Candidatus Saccharibacteria bacterium]